MKKVLISLILLSCAILLCFSESYKITDVQYETKGITRTYALSQKVPINTNKIFEDKDSFDAYINDLKQQLTNQRVFQSTDVTYIFLEDSSEGYIPVNLVVSTVDTLNIIGVPYPSYDSNTGFSLKLKVKDYNFLGSMETMDFDVNYQALGEDDLDDVTHVYGLNFGFAIPFKLIKIPASWNSTFSFSYTVGDPELEMEISEGIDFSIPLFSITSANVSFSQDYIQDPDYKSTHDDKYFKDSLSISFPFTIYSIPNWSNIYWSPYVGFSYRWDFDAFKHVSNSGIQDTSLLGPKLSFGHYVSAGRVNWLENYRDGFNFKIQQSLGYNFHTTHWTTNVSIKSEFYRKIESSVAFASRLYSIIDFGGVNHSFGSMIRGVRDKDWESPLYVLINLDLPLTLFHTDWGKLFGWDKLNFFNFEFQFSPFQDIVLGKNSYAGSSFNPKDGWYGTGFEMLVFPDRFRSIQGRVSFGVDTVQFLQKAGNKSEGIQNISNKLFNTGWRSNASSWYELSIGIGLFY